MLLIHQLTSPAFAITYPFAGQTLTPGVTYLFQWSAPTQPTCLLRFRYVNAASVGLLSPIPNINDPAARQNSSLGAVNYTLPTLNEFQTAGSPGLEYALFNQGTTTLGLRATEYNSAGSPVTPSANIVIYMRGELESFIDLIFPFPTSPYLLIRNPTPNTAVYLTTLTSTAYSTIPFTFNQTTIYVNNVDLTVYNSSAVAVSTVFTNIAPGGIAGERQI